MRAFHDSRDPPGWQFRKVDDMVAEARKDIARWKAYRAECEAGAKITKPEAIPRIVAGVNETIRDLKEQIEILRHLRKHLEKTVTSPEGVRRNRGKRTQEMNKPKFQLGQLLAMPGALEVMQACHRRHFCRPSTE